MKFVKIIGSIWITVGIGFIAWQWYSYRARGFDESVLQSSLSVIVQDSDSSIIFSPAFLPSKTLIFFPGALVQPEAYAPLLRKVAEQGYKVVIVKMPFRLAQYGYNKQRTLDLFRDTRMKYCLAGHSKGAAMAASFVFEKRAKVNGLVLIGTTHPKDFDLSDFKVPVLKIYGTRDGVADTGNVLANKFLLPKQTKYLAVEGGNHSQFAYYGHQLGDNPALISREEQEAVTLAALLKFLKDM